MSTDVPPHDRRAAAQTITLPLHEYEQLLKEGYTDHITELGNRRYWENNVLQLSNSPNPVAIIIIDIDDFKQYNDSHGHKVGDKTLKEIGDLLKRTVRSTDILARIGGDEFGLAFEFPKTDNDKTNAIPDGIIEKIRDNIREYNEHQLLAELKVKLSIGCETSFSHPHDLEQMFEMADQRMYDNKNEQKEYGGDKKTLDERLEAVSGNK